MWVDIAFVDGVPMNAAADRCFNAVWLGSYVQITEPFTQQHTQSSTDNQLLKMSI